MDAEWIGIIILIMCLVVMARDHFEKRSMQRTIDRLTDKLMARDYGEYKRHDRTLMREEPKIRKPQSFYDDPSVEVEDDKPN